MMANTTSAVTAPEQPDTPGVAPGLHVDRPKRHAGWWSIPDSRLRL